MRSFKDTTGRLWTLEIHVAAVRRIKGLVAVDLMALVEDGCKPLAALTSDPCKLVDVLWCLVQPQAQAAGVSDEDFGRALGGDALYDATEAFTEELFDFFPDWRGRNALHKMLAKGRAVREELLNQAQAEVDSLDPKEVAAELMRRARGSGASSGSSPAG